MSDWKQSVDTRLTELRDDYKTLLYSGIAAVAFILVGGGAAYNELRKDVAQSGAEIASANGKLDILIGMANDKPEASPTAK